MKTNCILGIDTSNYRASVAIVDTDNNIISSQRELLEVKKGERGLQQSFALFQHIKKLPQLIERLNLDQYNVVAVACSSKPRDVEGSYMPVFLAGQSLASSIASTLGVELYEFSHQEGHIAAAKHQTTLEYTERFCAFHFSGGTTECLLYEKGKLIIIGGTLDLAFGQVIDRVGVKLDLPFPAGAFLDEMVLGKDKSNNYEKITPVKVKDCYFNLSGLETQLLKLIDKGVDQDQIADLTFDQILQVINKTMVQIHEKYGVKDFLFAGGVSSSQYIRDNLDNQFNAVFACEELSGDNAVGIALLGGQAYGKKASYHNTTK